MLHRLPLRAYEARRARRANAIVRLSRQAGVLAQASSRAGGILRDGLMTATPLRVQLRRRDRILDFDPPPLEPA